jgi:hypothetical protein
LKKSWLSVPGAELRGPPVEIIESLGWSANYAVYDALRRRETEYDDACYCDPITPTT